MNRKILKKTCPILSEEIKEILSVRKHEIFLYYKNIQSNRETMFKRFNSIPDFRHIG